MLACIHARMHTCTHACMPCRRRLHLPDERALAEVVLLCVPANVQTCSNMNNCYYATRYAAYLCRLDARRQNIAPSGPVWSQHPHLHQKKTILIETKQIQN